TIIVIYLMSMQSRKKKKQYGFEIKPFSYDFLIASAYSALVLGFVLIVNNYRGIQNPVLIMIL
ncbi:unnamed protein product, partial [marine sediment metagenome]